jgi:hypothetical protein
MKKAVLLFTISALVMSGLASCNKCYTCTKVVKPSNNVDTTTYTYSTDLCNYGSQSAGANLSIAVNDLEDNGYICNKK